MADVTVKISEHKFGELFHRVIGSLPPEPVKGQSPGADEVDIPWGSDSGEGWSSHDGRLIPSCRSSASTR